MNYVLKSILLAGSLMVLLANLNIAMAQPAEKPRIDIEKLFTASGWMGDGEYGNRYITFSGADRTAPHSPPTSIKLTYTFGPNRWGGIYWQNIPDNWGDKPGNNYSGRGFSKITFWAKGETGTEIVEYKSGGIDNAAKKYRDSFVSSTGRISLTKDWRQYQIDLSAANLESVIGGFCWVASADYNSGETITFYIDDIVLE